MSEQNKAIARRIIVGIWNEKNPALIDDIYAPNFVMNTPDGDLHGPEGYRALYDTYTSAFPDCQFTLGDLIAEGDSVAIPYTFRGTHTGDLMDIAATGKQVTVEGTSIAHFEGSKVVRERVVWDTLSLMQQLGVVPMPEQAVG